MFILNHKGKRSSSLSRFVSVFLVGSTILFSLGLPMNADAQEMQPAHAAASPGTMPATDYPHGGSRWKHLLRGISQKSFAAPQTVNSVPRSTHRRRNAILGLLFVAGGSAMLAEGSGSRCSGTPGVTFQGQAPPLSKGTCTWDKIGGVGFVTGGAIALLIAASEGRGRNSTPANSSAGSSAGSSSSSLPGSQINSGDLAAAQSAIDQIQGVPHSEAPPVQSIGTNYGGATSITIQNNTASTLSVYLAGPIGMVIMLAPQGSQTATLAPGSYRIGGRVSDPSVEPFLGTASFQGGYRYRETFYISLQP